MKKVVIVTSIHADYDARVWRHATLTAQLGFDTHLICPWNVKNGLAKDGVTFHPFVRVNNRISRIWLLPFRVLRQVFSEIKTADIIHFHDIDLLPWMALLSIFGKNVVYDVHENYPDEMLTRYWIPDIARKPLYYIVKYVQYYLSKIINNIVLVTEYQAGSFCCDKIRTIYMKNYASLALMDNVKENYFERSDTVIFIGNQYVENGSLLLLDIAEEMLELKPNVTFYTSDRFSSKRFRHEYLSKINSKNLTNVHLISNVSPQSIMNILNDATIAINPVLRVQKQISAINTKLFEYMAAGLPIVSSDLPFPKNLLKETSAGFVAQPEDVSSFVNQIIRLIDDRNLAFQLGQNGKLSFTERYSWESQAPTLEHFYEEILKKSND